MARACEQCGEALSMPARGKSPRFCSTRCRMKAYRARKGSLPIELRREDRWVRWTPAKRPIQVNGSPASSTDPRTWTSYAKVRAFPRKGFVLGGGIGAIDLDHCLVDGKPTAAATAFLEKLPATYVEISPSGDGLHVWGRIPEGPGSRRVVDGLSVETYSTGRYITVTGRRFAGSVSHLADLT